MITSLKAKSDWVRKETLKIHRIAPETRLASSLSCIEIFTVLYYGKILKYDCQNPNWDKRDRFIISKAHGAISLYPILADLGFFDSNELNRVCNIGGSLGAIPDCNIPGFEIIAGSLGHGLGIACGMSMGLKTKKDKDEDRNENVFVLMGDGELWEGSVWEAVMFGGFHKLNNIILIIDNNKKSMLGYTKNILDLEPLENKFKDFRWEVLRVDGHDIEKLFNIFDKIKNKKPKPSDRPIVVIADTTKGKGIQSLENDPICHVKSLKCDEIDMMIK